jgi:hypothetical protein
MYYSAFRRRSRAQKRGQRMGRPPKLTVAQQAEARRRRAEVATHAELACSYGLGKSTFPGGDEAPRPLDLVSGAAKKRRSR